MAQAQPLKKAGYRPGCIGWLLITAGVLWVAVLMAPQSPDRPRSASASAPAPAAAPAPTAVSRVPDVGAQVTLFSADGKSIPLGRTQGALEQLDKAQRANDRIGVTNLIASQAVRLIASGTPALLLDRDGWLDPNYEVRVQGSGPHAGQSGWVWADTVK